MKVTKNVPEPAPVPPTTYDIVGLTEDEFDVIVGCLHIAESGSDLYDDGKPGKKRGEIGNATGIGGRVLFELGHSLVEESLMRLTRNVRFRD